MDELYLQQLRGLNYSLANISTLIEGRSIFYASTTAELARISHGLESVGHSIIEYQHSITNQPWFSFVVGSFVTIVASLLLSRLQEISSRKKFLYYLITLMEQQINLVIDIENQIIKFKNTKLKPLILSIERNPIGAWSVNRVFFPLFSTWSLPDRSIEERVKSDYINNQVGIIYRMSKDIPFIIDDLRSQLEHTINLNQRIAFDKLNSAEAQKQQYIENIQEYISSIENDMLEKNIPIYLLRLSEAAVVLSEKAKTSHIRWLIKFNPLFRFFFSKKEYLNAKAENGENMRLYFNEKVNELQQKIDIARKSYNNDCLAIKDYKEKIERQT